MKGATFLKDTMIEMANESIRSDFENSTLKILSNVRSSERYWHMGEASSIVDEITAGQFSI